MSDPTCMRLHRRTSVGTWFHGSCITYICIIVAVGKYDSPWPAWIQSLHGEMTRDLRAVVVVPGVMTVGIPCTPQDSPFAFPMHDSNSLLDIKFTRQSSRPRKLSILLALVSSCRGIHKKEVEMLVYMNRTTPLPLNYCEK